MIALRPYRQAKSMTQAQLAKKLQVTASAVTQWESGDRNPDIITLKKLSIILNCSADDLLKSIKT